MRRLLPQLSTSAAEPDQAAVQRIVGSEATTLLAAKLDGNIVGFLTLAMFPIPTGFRAWIEDVIVDEAARGRGLGEALTRKALESDAVKTAFDKQGATRRWLSPADTAAYRAENEKRLAPVIKASGAKVE